MFFVISGFLITRNILRDHQTGIFTFRRFYVRRIRRLFPALAVTLLATLVGGFLLLAPEDMARLGLTGLSAVVSLSNILFWREIGYFDAASALKPLLHTWSLAVEEQFYLLWPAVLILTCRVGKARSVLWIVSAIGVSSFASAEILRTVDPGAVFYLMPFRMFEMCAGAVVAVLDPDRPRSRLAQLATLTGLGVIAYSVARFDARTTQLHYWVLLPCLGAVLIIYGSRNRWSEILLSNRIATRIGAISYSLYLVHWPIVVFFKYGRTAEIPTALKWLLVAISFAAAAILYRVVELPLRSNGRVYRAPTSTRTALFASAALAMLVLAIGAHAWTTGGWPWRLPVQLRNIPNETALWTERNVHARVGSCFIYAPTAPTFDETSCLAKDPVKPNYLISGDSFGADAYVFLSKAYPDVNFLQATAGNCHPLISGQVGDELCKGLLDLIFTRFIPSNRLDGVYPFRRLDDERS